MAEFWPLGVTRVQVGLEKPARETGNRGADFAARQMLDPRFFGRDLLVEFSEAGLRGSGLV
jgi:hypothetical protein